MVLFKNKRQIFKAVLLLVVLPFIQACEDNTDNLAAPKNPTQPLPFTNTALLSSYGSNARAAETVSLSDSMSTEETIVEVSEHANPKLIVFKKAGNHRVTIKNNLSKKVTVGNLFFIGDDFTTPLLQRSISRPYNSPFIVEPGKSGTFFLEASANASSTVDPEGEQVLLNYMVDGEKGNQFIKFKIKIDYNNEVYFYVRSLQFTVSGKPETQELFVGNSSQDCSVKITDVTLGRPENGDKIKFACPNYLKGSYNYLSSNEYCSVKVTMGGNRTKNDVLPIFVTYDIVRDNKKEEIKNVQTVAAAIINYPKESLANETATIASNTPGDLSFSDLEFSEFGLKKFSIKNNNPLHTVKIADIKIDGENRNSKIIDYSGCNSLNSGESCNVSADLAFGSEIQDQVIPVVVHYTVPDEKKDLMVANAAIVSPLNTKSALLVPTKNLQFSTPGLNKLVIKRGDTISKIEITNVELVRKGAGDSVNFSNCTNFNSNGSCEVDITIGSKPRNDVLPIVITYVAGLDKDLKEMATATINIQNTFQGKSALFSGSATGGSGIAGVLVDKFVTKPILVTLLGEKGELINDYIVSQVASGGAFAIADDQHKSFNKGRGVEKYDGKNVENKLLELGTMQFAFSLIPCGALATTGIGLPVAAVCLAVSTGCGVLGSFTSQWLTDTGSSNVVFRLPEYTWTGWGYAKKDSIVGTAKSFGIGAVVRLGCKAVATSGLGIALEAVPPPGNVGDFVVDGINFDFPFKDITATLGGTLQDVVSGLAMGSFIKESFAAEGRPSPLLQ